MSTKIETSKKKKKNKEQVVMLEPQSRPPHRKQETSDTKTKISNKIQPFETKVCVTIEPPKISAFRTKSSNDRIQYNLYPWKQDKEIRLETIFPSIVLHSVEETHAETVKNFLNFASFQTLRTDYKTSWDNAVLNYSWYWEEKDLNVALGYFQHYPSKPKDCIFYLVQRKKKLFSCLIDQSFALQPGDGTTEAYANSESFFIQNERNVSSLVKIQVAPKKKNKTLYFSFSLSPFFSCFLFPFSFFLFPSSFFLFPLSSQKENFIAKLFSN